MAKNFLISLDMDMMLSANMKLLMGKLSFITLSSITSNKLTIFFLNAPITSSSAHTQVLQTSQVLIIFSTPIVLIANLKLMLIFHLLLRKTSAGSEVVEAFFALV
jgi:hypothetical protein